MKNILVTGTSTLIGYAISRSIKRAHSEYHIIGTSIFDDSPAIPFSDKFLKSLPTLHEEYMPWLLDVLNNNSIDLAIPGVFLDVSLWNQNRDIIDETGVKVVLNKKELIELCEDKWKFYKVLNDNNSNHLIPSSLSKNYQELTTTLGKTLLLKPRKGRASIGIVKITNESEFNSYRKRVGDDLMVQQYVGNSEEEYTVAAFGDGVGGFYTIMSLQRKLAKQGYTNFAEVLFNKGLENAVGSICEIFKPVGPTNFQFRRHNDEFKLLEINPRLSSATSIRTAFGYNDPLMAVKYYLEGKIPKQPQIRKGTAIRYIEDYIVYS